MIRSNEDTYFLDRDLAYQVALAHNTIELADGRRIEQACYYDGVPFEQAPDNLIHVPVESFSAYFQSHLDRIPTQVDPTIGEHNGDQHTVHAKLSAILDAVQALCKNSYIKKDAA